MCKSFLTLILTTFALVLNAQTRFTDQLQKSQEGQGTVVLHQSQTITDLVNGVTTAAPVEAKKAAPVKAKTTTATPQVEDTTQVTTPTVNTGTRVRMNGYRIQVYSGGNSRKSKYEAQMMGNRVRSLFSELSVYTHFVSPHWICRVGDFKTYEEAHEYLRQLRETGRFAEAVVVKSKIIAYY